MVELKELSTTELETNNGGLFGEIILGLAITALVDGVVIAATGKSTGEWVGSAITSITTPSPDHYGSSGVGHSGAGILLRPVNLIGSEA